LKKTLEARQWKSILCLGSLAWNHTFRTLAEKPRPFGHGRVVVLESCTRVVGSYHPSQQNTFTGKLTEDMLDAAICAFLSQ
jgi:uracil-DNA glycosylase